MATFWGQSVILLDGPLVNTHKHYELLFGKSRRPLEEVSSSRHAVSKKHLPDVKASSKYSKKKLNEAEKKSEDGHKKKVVADASFCISPSSSSKFSPDTSVSESPVLISNRKRDFSVLESPLAAVDKVVCKEVSDQNNTQAEKERDRKPAHPTVIIPLEMSTEKTVSKLSVLQSDRSIKLPVDNGDIEDYAEEYYSDRTAYSKEQIEQLTSYYEQWSHFVADAIIFEDEKMAQLAASFTDKKRALNPPGFSPPSSPKRTTRRSRSRALDSDRAIQQQYLKEDAEHQSAKEPAILKRLDMVSIDYNHKSLSQGSVQEMLPNRSKPIKSPMQILKEHLKSIGIGQPENDTPHQQPTLLEPPVPSDLPAPSHTVSAPAHIEPRENVRFVGDQREYPYFPNQEAHYQQFPLECPPPPPLFYGTQDYDDYDRFHDDRFGGRHPPNAPFPFRGPQDDYNYQHPSGSEDRWGYNHTSGDSIPPPPPGMHIHDEELMHQHEVRDDDRYGGHPFMRRGGEQRYEETHLRRDEYGQEADNQLLRTRREEVSFIAENNSYSQHSAADNHAYRPMSEATHVFGGQDYRYTVSRLFSPGDCDFRAVWIEQTNGRFAPSNHPFFHVDPEAVITKPYSEVFDEEAAQNSDGASMWNNLPPFRDALTYKTGTWYHLKDIPRLTRANLDRLSEQEALALTSWFMNERRAAVRNVWMLQEELDNAQRALDMLESERCDYSQSQIRTKPTPLLKYPPYQPTSEHEILALAQKFPITDPAAFKLGRPENTYLMRVWYAYYDAKWQSPETARAALERDRHQIKNRKARSEQQRLAEKDNLRHLRKLFDKCHAADQSKFNAMVVDAVMENGKVVERAISDMVNRIVDGRVPPLPGGPPPAPRRTPGPLVPRPQSRVKSTEPPAPSFLPHPVKSNNVSSGRPPPPPLPQSLPPLLPGLALPEKRRPSPRMLGHYSGTPPVGMSRPPFDADTRAIHPRQSQRYFSSAVGHYHPPPMMQTGRYYNI